MIGIYKIISPSGKIYIGQSRNIEKRWSDYRLGYYHSGKLKNSFKKHGFENHTFEILEECEVENLNERERFYQDKFDVLGENGLNHILQQTNEKPRMFDKEYREKIRITSTGRVKSKESRLKTSESLLGKTHSKERVEKNRLGQLNRGSVLDTTREKCRLAASKPVINKITGEIFDSNKLAANSIGVRPDWLSARLRGDVLNTTSFEYL